MWRLHGGPPVQGVAGSRSRRLRPVGVDGGWCVLTQACLETAVLLVMRGLGLAARSQFAPEAWRDEGRVWRGTLVDIP